MKHLYPLILLGIWVLASCGPTLSEPEILATADAIRARTPIVNMFDDRDRDREATSDANWREEEGSQATVDAIEAEHQATQEAEWDAMSVTAEAAHATYEAEMTATREAFIDGIVATDMAMLTEEAETPVPPNCAGGCIAYPSWCEPPVKGNVSQVAGKTGERIYHMPGDEFYDEVEINREGEYYFCTPEEAEAVGFRRAYN